MNYMEQVAKMLGVEIGEEFKVDCYSRKFKITDSGFYWYLEEIDSWHSIWSIALDLLIGKSQIIKLSKPILEDEEKKYLRNVIKPFRKDIVFIQKTDRSVNYDLEYLTFQIHDLLDGSYYMMNLSCFKKGTMYKGMELEKEYSLEELGL